MASAALRVAGRQLSQRSGAGAPVLLRQVRGGPSPGRREGLHSRVPFTGRGSG
uniref:Uncharacterized protein n=1 Tax=Oryctolagus cuniculus TaxID=9986 RepID=A0A5F9DHK3_RABIT